jgi:predicted GNAT superfamily acetyltransferase
MPTTQLIVRDVERDEMHDCLALYIAVMGLRPEDGGINVRLLTALRANGGLVVGAFADDLLVGFAYSFLGRDASASEYQYSQLAVVDAAWQGKGVGRRLKQGQRERCLAGGLTRMRWAFDPLKIRNGHFNLSVLGAELIAFVPNMYGDLGFGVDAGTHHTDRCIVEWDLQKAHERGPIGLRDLPSALDVGSPLHRADDVLLPVPVDWDGYRTEHSERAASRLIAEYRTAFARLLTDGWVGVRCESGGDGVAVYQFQRPEAAAA